MAKKKYEVRSVMATDKKFGCIVFEDAFNRLDKFLDDEQFGRVMRSALNYGFTGELPGEFVSPIEEFAFDELKTTFDRNKESYDDASMNGLIGSAMHHAKTVDNLKDRLENIEGLTNYEKADIIKKWKARHKDS